MLTEQQKDLIIKCIEEKASEARKAAPHGATCLLEGLANELEEIKEVVKKLVSYQENETIKTVGALRDALRYFADEDKVTLALADSNSFSNILNVTRGGNGEATIVCSASCSSPHTAPSGQWV